MAEVKVVRPVEHTAGLGVYLTTSPQKSDAFAEIWRALVQGNFVVPEVFAVIDIKERNRLREVEQDAIDIIPNLWW